MMAIRHILVATDFGAASDEALRYGRALAHRLGARLEVLHVTPDRAVGKVLPGFKKGAIQKDDDVATRLKVS